MASPENLTGASSRLLDRVSGRLDRSQLRQESVGGKGQVFRGELASRALETLGARAMTLDKSIIVGDDVQSHSAEGQALFAHEMYHVTHSGGSGGDSGSNFRDAEEIAARAEESAVLSRAAMQGGYEGGYTAGAGGGSGEAWGRADSGGKATNPRTSTASEKNPASSSDPDPIRGYWMMVEMGYSHADIVDELTRKAIGAKDEEEVTKLDRHGDKAGTI
jgi:hypothetical protein